MPGLLEGTEEAVSHLPAVPCICATLWVYARKQSSRSHSPYFAGCAFFLWFAGSPDYKEPLIDSAAHLRHIFSRLLLAEKLDVHPVHLAFFAIADEKICTEAAPPHSISGSITKKDSPQRSLLLVCFSLSACDPSPVRDRLTDRCPGSGCHLRRP